MASLLSAALWLCVGGIQAERHGLVLLCVTATFMGLHARHQMGDFRLILAQNLAAKLSCRKSKPELPRMIPFTLIQAMTVCRRNPGRLRPCAD